MLGTWPGGGRRGFWLAGALLGLVLILIGVLIFLEPDLLAYVVASLFILVGAALLGVAFHMRERVTYRRMDPRREARDDADEV